MLFFNVRKGGFDDRANMIVRQGVIYIFAGFPIGDKVTPAQNLQLMGNGRLRHPQKIRKITNAERRSIQGKKDTLSLYRFCFWKEARPPLYKTLFDALIQQAVIFT